MFPSPLVCIDCNSFPTIQHFKLETMVQEFIAKVEIISCWLFSLISTGAIKAIGPNVCPASLQ